MNNNSNNDSYSVGSLICGIVSLFIIPRIFGLIAVILGIIGLSTGEEKKSNAAVGLAIGIFSFLYSFYATQITF